ncbi:MAG: hypothetical protein JOY67_14835 [Hyphomicrobiales bacterium]|nr:hypothetical protein [Hyphomicrobiales bacterium]MBV9519804.1 hypothetical protein [Hyphomicrobiales bacterium]
MSATLSLADKGRFALRGDRTLLVLIFVDDRQSPVPAHDHCLMKGVLHAEFDNVGWECPQILAALDRCDDIYFDDVSQIRMDGWTKEALALAFMRSRLRSLRQPGPRFHPCRRNELSPMCPVRT